MELETQKNIFKQLHLDNKRGILLSVITIIAIILIVSISASAVILSNDNIYNGVYIGDIPVGGLSAEKAKSVVVNKYKIEPENIITLKSGDVQTQLPVSELDPLIDIDKSIDAALEIGRQGNLFKRLSQIRDVKKNHVIIPVELQLNEDVLGDKITQIASKVDVPQKDIDIKIQGSTLVVTKGTSGKRIQVDNAKNLVKKAIIQNSTNPVELVTEIVQPKELNVDMLYQEVCGDPVNASYRVENQKLIVVDEKPGIMFDKKEAEEIINKSTGDTIKIPIVIKPAEITKSQVLKGLFPDLLAAYTSKFNEGDAERSHNIRMASNSINGVVLGPGDVFSYNDTLGPRTIARGYKTAHVYVGNRVEPGLGGGICQISSTLFNAVVLSDLSVVSRTSHSMPVSYVPIGRDATVSYGSVDFKFSNNTEAPIKILSTVSHGVSTIKIYGVKNEPTKTISMTTERLSVTPAEVVQKKDSNLTAGTVKVEQRGLDGSVYNTYKVTKVNGSVVKSEFLTKSRYMPITRIEIIGTKPKEAEQAVEIKPAVPSTSPAPTITSVPQTPDRTSSPTPSSQTLKPSASPSSEPLEAALPVQ